MALVKLEVVSREPFEEGRDFGSVGAYERIEAVAHYEIDPQHPANASLTDVGNVAQDDDGLVRFTGDVSMLLPADPPRSNRALLVEVPNRGKRTAQRQFNYAPIQLKATDYIDPGDGFLMRNGWTVAWCGWQWDVPKDGAGLSLRAPLVDVSKAPNSAGREQMQLRFQPNQHEPHFALTDHHTGPLGGHEAIPTGDPDDAGVVLMVREHMYAPATIIDRGKWQFARDVGGQPETDPSHIWLDGGFEAGLTYDIVYAPAQCYWGQAGLVAMRDLGAFLVRNGQSPVHGNIEHTYAEGISQCGRFLRTFLNFGMNADESGTRVYDGMLVHIAGGRRGEFNHRYGQPSVQPTPSFGHLFPFADAPQVDPFTNKTAGLLDACRTTASVPKIFYTDTAAEYWRGDASLAHQGLGDTPDAELPPEVRRYLYASAQHSPGLLPLTDVNASGTRNQNLNNFIDYRPLYRASLENLRAWVAEGTDPPPSAFPESGTGTAISRREAVEILLRSGRDFEFPVEWGVDLQSEHERYLAEEHVGRPVVVTDYPAAIKAFYMFLNEDERTVRAMDVLVPKVGEIIGGSQREHRLDVLTRRIEASELDPSEYWWYLDLRRHGSAPHAGFGLGFERLIQFMTGVANIREAIPFPRVPGYVEF